MKKQSRTVPRRRQSVSPTPRHLPLVDILIDTPAELQELGLRPAGWPGWADRTVTGRGDSRPLLGHGPSGQLAAVRVAGGR